MLLIAVAELSKIGAGSGGGITKTGKKAFELTAAGAAIAAAKKDKEEPEEQEEETVEESNSRVQEEVADERPYQEQYGSFVSGG
jgi:hypothetical protein